MNSLFAYRRSRPAFLILFVTLAALIPFAADAYGPIGHQTVGAIADKKLAGTPAGRKITLLLDGFTLEKASVIPDEIKGWDKKGADDPTIFHYTSRPRIDAQLRDFWKANPPTYDLNSPRPNHHWFHYTDVPVIRPQKYADGKAGRSKWDIVHAMKYCIEVLQGTQPDDNERNVTKPIAIILLAHFVGDIHQPLHVGAQFFDEKGQPVDPEKGGTAYEDQGGNTILFRHSPDAAQQTGHNRSRLHGFWDNHAVMAHLPKLPVEMPKEERRSRNDAAKDELVAKLTNAEPKNWKMDSKTEPRDYPEAWANEILPVAREAHDRLIFSKVAPKQEEHGIVAAGEAEERPNADGVSYLDWTKGIVHDHLHKAGWRLADLLEKAVR